MADYKSMYYHLAGRMATSIEVLETTIDILKATSNTLVATCDSLSELTEKLKNAQLQTEEMFISSEDDKD